MNIIFWGFWLIALVIWAYAIWQLAIAFYHWLWPDGFIGNWWKS